VIALAFALALQAAPAASGLGPTLGVWVHFRHYQEPYAGQERAAVLLEPAHACPVGTPNGMTDCANLRFLTLWPGEGENGTNVLLEGVPTGAYTNNGDDWRCCVPHDPAGEFNRSWHFASECPNGF
jgi:hypothetical protein